MGTQVGATARVGVCGAVRPMITRGKTKKSGGCETLPIASTTCKLGLHRGQRNAAARWST